MSKNKTATSVKEKRIDLEREIMSKVTSGQIAMRPKWYFILGSMFSIVGMAASIVASVFLVNIMAFIFRRHGPMGQWRLEAMLDNFPIWIPVLIVTGIVLGVWLLKKYDFSYKKNFFAIAIGFIASIIIAGYVIDRLGLNDIWSRGRMMRKFYRNIENRKSVIPGGANKL